MIFMHKKLIKHRKQRCTCACIIFISQIRSFFVDSGVYIFCRGVDVQVGILFHDAAMHSFILFSMLADPGCNKGVFALYLRYS